MRVCRKFSVFDAEEEEKEDEALAACELDILRELCTLISPAKNHLSTLSGKLKSESLGGLSDPISPASNPMFCPSEEREVLLDSRGLYDEKLPPFCPLRPRFQIRRQHLEDIKDCVKLEDVADH